MRKKKALAPKPKPKAKKLNKVEEATTNLFIFDPQKYLVRVKEVRSATEELELAGWRVPKGTPPAAAKLAAEARKQLADVMMGAIPARDAKNVLAAAIEIRDEVCGRIPSKIDLNAEMSFASLVAMAGAREQSRDPAKLPTPIEVPDATEAEGTASSP